MTDLHQYAHLFSKLIFFNRQGSYYTSYIGTHFLIHDLYLETQVLSQATFFVKDIETSGLTASAPPLLQFLKQILFINQSVLL
jgi:hypothetical protein